MGATVELVRHVDLSRQTLVLSLALAKVSFDCFDTHCRSKSVTYTSSQSSPHKLRLPHMAAPDFLQQRSEPQPASAVVCEAQREVHPLGYTWKTKRLRTGGADIKLAWGQLKTSTSNGVAFPDATPVEASSQRNSQPHRSTASADNPNSAKVKIEVASPPAATQDSVKLKDEPTESCQPPDSAHKAASTQPAKVVRRSKRARRTVSVRAPPHLKDRVCGAGQGSVSVGVHT